ncbi:MAG: prolyl oligopeptidase family serine peptidase [bacterium]
MISRNLRALVAALLLAATAAATGAPAAGPAPASTWQRPPASILEVLRAPLSPYERPSPDGRTLALLQPVRYPPIADLARPMLRLAGVRVDPATNGRYGETYYAGLALLRVADGGTVPVAFPGEERIGSLQWCPDGRRFAFLQQGTAAIELWLGETASGRVRRVEDLRINPMLYSELTWMPDGKSLLVKRVPPSRGPAPEPPLAPSGPRVQESEGRSASSTYEARDLLTGPEDEAKFEYYALSQLAVVDFDSGRVTPIGEPGLYAAVRPSPDGRHLLVERLKKPWSYTHDWNRFAKDVEVWSARGAAERVVAQLPLADAVPIQGVPEGPRQHGWRPTAPATLVWLEALDGGDPGRKADRRDKVMAQEFPFDGAARELYRAPHRVQYLSWGEKGGLVLVNEYERERRWRHVCALDADAKSPVPRPLIDLSINDRYNDPGYPVYEQLPNGYWVVVQDGDAIYLDGQGSSPQGDRPFLDRFSLKTRKSERLFRSDSTRYETFEAWLDLRAKRFLVRSESPAEPPNYVARTLTRARRGAPKGEAAWESAAQALTSFADPVPQIRAITKEIVTFQRADGTPLSFTLCLPPGYRKGTRLPTVIDAYPLEYSDPGTAGQVSGTSKEFTTFWGPTSLFFLLDGYAVLGDVSMPVIGDPDTAYDTFVEQLTANAQAAIDKAVELGVTDRDRVGVMGHSHGALMVATLLAHTDLFRAGIARSGAYNHTLRPFGFQSERRTLYAARDTYLHLSPIMYADKINEPLLLIHGDADQNPGTVPLQSEKLFEAVRGTGGTVRLVMLPYEQHGYQSREAVEDVLAEQLAWFDRYVKKAPPRATTKS